MVVLLAVGHHHLFLRIWQETIVDKLWLIVRYHEVICFYLFYIYIQYIYLLNID